MQQPFEYESPALKLEAGKTSLNTTPSDIKLFDSNSVDTCIIFCKGVAVESFCWTNVDVCIVVRKCKVFMYLQGPCHWSWFETTPLPQILAPLLQILAPTLVILAPLLQNGFRCIKYMPQTFTSNQAVYSDWKTKRRTYTNGKQCGLVSFCLWFDSPKCQETILWFELPMRPKQNRTILWSIGSVVVISHRWKLNGTLLFIELKTKCTSNFRVCIPSHTPLFHIAFSASIALRMSRNNQTWKFNFFILPVWFG